MFKVSKQTSVLLVVLNAETVIMRKYDLLRYK